MELIHERSVLIETWMFDGEGGISTTSGDVAVRDLLRIRRLGDRQDHACNGCGQAGLDVDLWAEDSETGEQLWLCDACGEW